MSTDGISDDQALNALQESAGVKRESETRRARQGLTQFKPIPIVPPHSTGPRSATSSANVLGSLLLIREFVGLAHVFQFLIPNFALHAAAQQTKLT